MRLIDADGIRFTRLLSQQGLDMELVAKAAIDNMPTVDAEPVRHEGDTTFIGTNNLEGYADRIIVSQGTRCKVYYADEPVRHGRWEDDMRTDYKAYHPYTYKRGYKCSLCGRSECTSKEPYCPNCGANMDAETQDEV